MKKEKTIPAYKKDVFDPKNRGGGADELKKAPLNKPWATHDGATPDKKKFKISGEDERGMKKDNK